MSSFARLYPYTDAKVGVYANSHDGDAKARAEALRQFKEDSTGEDEEHEKEKKRIDFDVKVGEEYRHT